MDFSSIIRAVAMISQLLAFLVAPLAALWRFVRWRVHLARLAAKMPGPRGVPIFGNALEPKSLQPHDVYQFGIDLMTNHGKFFRIYLGPILVVYVEHTSDLEVFLTGHKYLEKGIIYSFLQPWLGTGLLTSAGAKWRSRRKILTPAFHFSILDQFIPVFNSCGDEFVLQLRKRADGSCFDVWPLVSLLTLDVICETAMGVKIKAQTNSDSAYVKAVKDISTITVARMFQLWYLLDFIFFRSPVGRRYQRSLDVVHGMTDKVIRERKAELEAVEGENVTPSVDELGRRRRVAFLDLLLLTARDGSLSDGDIREEVDTFMFEGHDTTSSAISFTIFLLSRHQDVQDKVLKELESIFNDSEPLKPSMQQLSELQYLEMVIKETLRLYPPVPLMTRKIVEDTKVPSGPYVVPAGALLAVAPFALHRDPEVFPDPERFDPDRFSPATGARRHPYAYIPFSAGPRNCIGQRFAMLELKSVLAKVVWNFRVLPVADFEPQLSWELILKSANGLPVRMEQRRAGLP